MVRIIQDIVLYDKELSTNIQVIYDIEISHIPAAIPDQLFPVNKRYGHRETEPE